MNYLAVCTEWYQSGSSLYCNGELSIIPVDQLITRFELSQLDPEILASMFAGGFALVGSFYVLGITTRTILNAIRRG